MTPSEIVVTSVYLVGVIAYLVTFFIQRAEIRKLKSITEQIDRYFKIFNVDEFEKFIKLKEKSFDAEKTLMINEWSVRMSDAYLERYGEPKLKEKLREIDAMVGEHVFELRSFVLDFLSFLPEKDQATILKNTFPEIRQVHDHRSNKKS